MTKNKRFTYLNYSRDGHIGSFYLNDKPITNKEVWDLLNEQDEQIKKLKQENKMLKNNINKLNDAIEYYLKTLLSQHRELYKQSEIKRINLSIENNLLKEQLKNDDNFNFKYTEDFERIDANTLRVEDTHTKIDCDGKKIRIILNPPNTEPYTFEYHIIGIRFTKTIGRSLK